MVRSELPEILRDLSSGFMTQSNPIAFNLHLPITVIKALNLNSKLPLEGTRENAAAE